MEEDDNRYRRRSSFMQRRLSSVHRDFGSPKETGFSDLGSYNKEEETKLTGFISKLKNEKKDWKKLLERLKKENLELKQKSPSVIDHTCSWELLTSEDQQFLQNRVDYVALRKLLDSTAEAVALRQKRTVATTKRLVTLAQGRAQSNNDLISLVIWKSIHQFDELDLCCNHFANGKDLYKSDIFGNSLM